MGSPKRLGLGTARIPDYAPLSVQEQAEGVTSHPGAEAVITTESGKTVAVTTVAGYAHAEWPTEWGQPQTVESYDTSSLDFHAD